VKKYESYTICPSLWNKEFPSHWCVLPMYAVAKEKSICNCVDLPLLSVYLDVGVVPFSAKAEKRTNVTSKDLSKYQRVDFGDFVLNNQQAWRGSVGISFDTGIVSPAYVVLSMNDYLDSRYANYLFRSRIMVEQYLINSKSVGSIQRNIYWPALKRTKVLIPSRDEQDQIVRFLDWKVSSINKLINIQKEQIRVIEELKEKAVCEVLLHGIDVGVSYKDSGIEWIGSIPERWKVIKIKWLFDEVDERNTDQTTELLTFSKKRGLLPFAEASDKMPSASDLSNYKILHKGQLLENRMQAWHGMFICSDREGCVSPDYSIFSASKEREVSVKFYEYVFRSHIWVEQFANASRGVGSGFNRLYTPQFGAIHTVYPAIDEQRRIVEYLDKKTARLNAVITQIERRIEGLEELKLTLIADTVTGKIDVRGIDVPEYEYVEETIDDNNEDCEEETEEQED
jgi:type I restriction enzyme S subunit